jgi:high affinity sulfate transporter 1
VRPIPRGPDPAGETSAAGGLTLAGGAAPGGALDRLPGLRTLRSYKVAWLRDDAVAGIVLSAMLVPVGVAYAVASGVPAINGLYATAIPLLVYALLGPSRILVLGPDSSLAPVILGVVVPLAAGVPGRAVAVAAAMAIVSGAVCMLAGLLRLGFVTELLSKPIRYGYMNGMAAVVLISQLPKLLGFSIESEGPLRDLWAIGQGIANGKANWAAAALGIGTFAVIRLSKRFSRFPGILAAVVGATLITAWLRLPETAGVKVLGPVPQGLPDLAIPWLRTADIVPILAGGVAVAIVAFADTSILSRTFAARAGTRVDPNQEMVALGAANLAAGFFQGFPISSSSSRTPVAEAAGARTQLTGVVGALIVALVIVAAPMLFRNLPYAALAGVVISAALGLFELADVARIYRIQRWEFWLCILCTLGVAVFGAIAGIGVAILIAILEFLWDAWRPHFAILGEPDGVEGYHDVTRYPDARRIPGIVLFRWDAPLFFANAEFFSQCVQTAIAASPTPVRRVIVSGAPITGIDVTSADSLAELAAGLERDGILLCFAELKDPVKDELKRFGLFDRLGETRFFPTVHSAVRACGDPAGA